MAELFKKTGNESFRAGRYEEAARAYSSGLALNPCDELRAVLLSNLSTVRLKQCNWEGALQEAKAAIAIDATLSKAHFNIGRALLELGRLDDALAALMTTQSLEPENKAVSAALDRARMLVRTPTTSSTAVTHECCKYCRLHPRPHISTLHLHHLYLADHFYFSTVLRDEFPSAESEGLFGIKMGTDLGTLVFSCWQRVLCLSGIVAAAYGSPSPYACPAAVAAALSSGSLPAMFEAAVRGLAAQSEVYSLRMTARGFRDIPWDRAFLFNVATVNFVDELHNHKAHWKPFAAAFDAASAVVPLSPSAISFTGVRFMYGADAGGACTEVALLPSNALLGTGAPSPVLALCDIPLILCRVLPRDPRDNQAATYFMIDPDSGLAPPPWQHSIGEIIAFRSDHKPFKSTHFYALWNFFNVVLDEYGDYAPAKVRRRHFSPTKFQEFMTNYEPGLLW